MINYFSSFLEETIIILKNFTIKYLREITEPLAMIIDELDDIYIYMYIGCSAYKIDQTYNDKFLNMIKIKILVDQDV